MIWFNLKKLENKLAHNDLPEEAGFQYLLAWIIFLGLAMYLPEETLYSHEGWDISESLMDLLISIAGISLTFKINRKGNNEDFLKRFFALSFVQILRLAVLFTLLLILFKSVMFIIPLEWFEAASGLLYTDPAYLLYSLGLSILYYYLLMRSFSRINNSKFIAEKSVMQ